MKVLLSLSLFHSTFLVTFLLQHVLPTNAQEKQACPSSLRLPTFIDSHMVLQRIPQKARLWGWAAAGAKVSVAMNGGSPTIHTQATPNGTWELELAHHAGVDNELVISETIVGANCTSNITLTDIAFGDVFFCSGQSNMLFTVALAFNAEQEIADSINYPHLRLATAQKVKSNVTQDDIPSRTYYNWARSSPAALLGNIPNGSSKWEVYSATCYFYGREMYKSFGGLVPIGLVTSCWDGQPVEAFSSPEALVDPTCGGTRPLQPPGNDTINGTNDAPVAALRPSEHALRISVGNTLLWNAMIHPFLPMRFAGVIWYQGESNSHDTDSYACRFPAMISDWRMHWGVPDLPFVYVQLAGYHNGTTWPRLRAAQGAALQLPNVAMATAVDLGDPTSPEGNVHPRRKQQVGRRLTVTMLALYYKRPLPEYNGPTLKGVHIAAYPNGTSTAQLQLIPGGLVSTIHFAGSGGCVSCCNTTSFETLTHKGKWKAVDRAYVRGHDQVWVETTVNSSIYGIRYGWSPSPECMLYNGATGGPEDPNVLPMVPWTWCAFPSGQGPWVANPCLLEPVHETEQHDSPSYKYDEDDTTISVTFSYE